VKKIDEKKVSEYRYSFIMLCESAMDGIKRGDMREVTMVQNRYGGLFLRRKGTPRDKGDTIIYKFKNPPTAKAMFYEVLARTSVPREKVMAETMRNKAWGRRKEDFYNSLFDDFKEPCEFNVLQHFTAVQSAQEKTKAFLLELAEEAERSIIRSWCWSKQKELDRNADEIIKAYIKKSHKKKAKEE